MNDVLPLKTRLTSRKFLLTLGVDVLLTVLAQAGLIPWDLAAELLALTTGGYALGNGLQKRAG